MGKSVFKLRQKQASRWNKNAGVGNWQRAPMWIVLGLFSMETFFPRLSLARFDHLQVRFLLRRIHFYFVLSAAQHHVRST